MPTPKNHHGERPCCARGSGATGQRSPESESQSGGDDDLVRDLMIATRDGLPADLAALSAREAAALYMVFDRYMAALWQVHRRTLYPLFVATFGQLVAVVTEADEPEEPTPAH